MTPIRIDANGFQVRDQEARDQESEERLEYFLLGTEPELAPIKSQNLDDLFEDLGDEQNTDAGGKRLPLFEAKTLNTSPQTPSAGAVAPLPLFDTAGTLAPKEKDKTKALRRTEKTVPQRMQAEDAFE